MNANFVEPSFLEEARRLLLDHRAREDGGDPNVIHLPDSILPELHRTAGIGLASKALQIVPFHADGWNPEAFEHLVWRQVATMGHTVERVYVAPHRGVASDILERQLALDATAGVRAYVTFVTALPEDMQGATGAGLWILDDTTVVSADPSTDGISDGWAVSRRSTDVHAALATWRAVVDVAEDPTTAVSATLDLEEPLVLSADLVGGVADILCAGDHVAADGCSWYHGTWQYLRLLDMVSTPTWHSAFYLENLGEALSAAPKRRVLITGTADYSMFAYVDMAATNVSADPEITVVDMCATPLFACRWYGKRAGRPVNTIGEDILTFGESESQREAWDIIVTDAFLTRFSASDCDKIAKVWFRLLAPGGSLITTIRIHSRTPKGRDEDSAVRDFSLRANKRAERWQPFLDCSPEEIAAKAETYARRMVSSDLGSEVDVLKILEGAGFAVRSECLAEVPGELHPTTYLEVTCVRQQSVHNYAKGDEILHRDVVIIHGTGGNPDENWFPWLATQVRGAGYRAEVPQFPTPDDQNIPAWLEVLDGSTSPLGAETTLVGHSLGCALILRALERPAEAIEASVFVSGFVGELGNPDFDPLNAPFFLEPFDWEAIRRRAGRVLVFAGSDDPYVPLSKGSELAERLGAELTVVSAGGHLNTAAGYTEFPDLWDALQDIWKQRAV
jgi:predicted alpha/beta hydrolase family esterase